MKTESEINHCIDLILADDKYYADEYRNGFRCALGWVLSEMHNTLFEEPREGIMDNKSSKT
jgi:hypothetical protein